MSKALWLAKTNSKQVFLIFTVAHAHTQYIYCFRVSENSIDSIITTVGRAKE